MNQKQFTSKLSNVIRSAKNIRENVQSLIIAALEHYRDSGDTVYLSQLVNGIVGVKALPTRAITDYIREYANVAWVSDKAKDGQIVKRYKKASKDEPVTVTMPEMPWYDHESNKGSNSVRTVSAFNRAANLVSSLEDAIKKGNVDDKKAAKAVIDALKPILPKAETAEIAAKLEEKEAKKAAIAVAKQSATPAKQAQAKAG